MCLETKIVGTVKTCSIEGCAKRAQARTYCSTHYSRWHRNGDPNKARLKAKTFEESYAARTRREGDCIVWTGGRDSDGYGLTSLRGQDIRSHRAVWITHNGAITSGLEVHHKCYNRACVNIEHLTLVTRQEQMSDLSGAYKTSKTGLRGISKKGKRYLARVQHLTVRKYIGTFNTVEQALEAQNNYKKENGIDL